MFHDFPWPPHQSGGLLGLPASHSCPGSGVLAGQNMGKIMLSSPKDCFGQLRNKDRQGDLWDSLHTCLRTLITTSLAVLWQLYPDEPSL